MTDYASDSGMRVDDPVIVIDDLEVILARPRSNKQQITR